MKTGWYSTFFPKTGAYMKYIKKQCRVNRRVVIWLAYDANQLILYGKQTIIN